MILLEVIVIGTGLAGLFGLGWIPEKFKGRSWSKDYIRSGGWISLLFGIALWGWEFLSATVSLPLYLSISLILLIGVPFFLYSLKIEAKYDKLLADNVP